MPATLTPDRTRDAVMTATRELDGVGVRDALMTALEQGGVDAAVCDLMLPVLKQIGDEWEAGQVGVVHEHFVSSTFRGILGDLRQPLAGDQVGTAVLACPPKELHDLPLELFAAMLHSRGWRTVSLGANTPMAAIGEACRFLRADVCILAGTRPTAFQTRMPSLERLSRSVPLFLAGEGARRLGALPAGVGLLGTDLREAADVIATVLTARSEATATVEA